jgi:hypothetical protein
VSLNRLIFYSAMIGGWAALVGWFVSELFLFRRDVPGGFWGFVVVLLTAGILGGCIAGSLALLGGVASGTLKGQFPRFFPAFLGGMIGGLVGALPGNSIFLLLKFNVFLILGWTMVGLAIGAVEGIYDRSPKKLRNGLIGGGIGGFLGGIIFILLGGQGMAERAAGFVILGMCIGCFIGLAQVLLKEAWLTVEAGFRPGRQLVLSLPETVMGTSEKAALPFIAYGAKGVEPVHVRIMRRDDGSYLLQDNNTRTGTFVNGRPIQGAVVLRDNDVIQLGVNLVRFREAHRQAAREAVPVQAVPVQAVPVQALPVARPSAVVAAGPPPLPQAALPATAPARPKPPPVPPGVVARPSGGGVSPISVKPAPAPTMPAARPPAPAPAVSPSPAAAATAPAPRTCPICGRAGTAVAQSAKLRCASCGINF